MNQFSAMIVASLVGLTLSTSAWAAKYQLDVSHTEIGFSVKHLVISKVKGHFGKFDGGFDYDSKAKTVTNVDIKIQSASVDTNDKKRDEHLSSPDFFDVAKFPVIEFKADKITGVEAGKTFKVPGTLTLHGVTKPVTLDVEFRGAATDPWGNEHLAFGATTEVKRADWGVKWNKSMDKGGVVVGEDVSIAIESEGVKAK